jgi:hypothetical protein
MKNIIILLLIFILTISCKRSNPELDPFIEQIAGTWMDEDIYQEYKIRESIESWQEIEGIRIQLNEDGGYVVSSELEFGIPEGPGTWAYDNELKIITFYPAASVNFDTTLNFFWKDILLDDTSLSVNYYSTDKEPGPDGTIETNRIPRRLVR